MPKITKAPRRRFFNTKARVRPKQKLIHRKPRTPATRPRADTGHPRTLILFDVPITRDQLERLHATMLRPSSGAPPAVRRAWRRLQEQARINADQARRGVLPIDPQTMAAVVGAFFALVRRRG